jgi:hypothetical protein
MPDISITTKGTEKIVKYSEPSVVIFFYITVRFERERKRR